MHEASFASHGTVDTIRFMGANGEVSIQAPLGLLRQDMTLSGQLYEYRRRIEALQQYRLLIAESRNRLGIRSDSGRPRSGSDEDGDGVPVEALSSVTREIHDQISAVPKTSMNSAPAKVDFSTPPQLPTQSTQPPSPSRTPPPTTADNLVEDANRAVSSSSTAASIQFYPAASVPRTVDGGDSMENSQPAKRTPSPDPVEASPVFISVPSSTAVSSSQPTAQQVTISLFRSALVQQERYLPCYYCARDILHVEFGQHVAKCKVATEALCRRMFLNPLRFCSSSNVPQAPLPPIQATEDEFDEYAMECSKCIGKSLMNCPHCQRKFNIHELQGHAGRCIGRKGVANEILQMSQQAPFPKS